MTVVVPMVTPLVLAGFVQVAVVPLEVKTYPLEPMARRVALFVPLPMIKSPVDVIGDSALNAADAVVCPVPPLATASVPAIVMVPVVVIGPPLVVRPVVPPLTLTLVTVPVPEGVAHVPSPRQKVVADALTPEFKLVTGKFPVTPVVSGRPVAFVKTTAEGVPSAGVVSVGDAERTTEPLPVDVVTPVPPYATPTTPEVMAVPAIAIAVLEAAVNCP